MATSVVIMVVIHAQIEYAIVMENAKSSSILAIADAKNQQLDKLVK